jgi:hypothetical protein
MKYAAELGSGAMIYSYIPSLVKIGSGIQKLMGDTQTHRYTGKETGWISHKPTLIFQDKESRLRILIIVDLIPVIFCVKSSVLRYYWRAS